MSVHACRDCKQPVSWSAKTCPHCGSRRPHPTRQLTLILGIIICGTLIWVASSQNKEAAKPRSQNPITIFPERVALKSEQKQPTITNELNALSIERAISDRRVLIGMSQDEARRAWGDPETISTTKDHSGISEIWMYRSGSSIHFESGKVTLAHIQGDGSAILERRDKRKELESFRDAINRHEIVKGMPEDAVRESWGNPNRVEFASNMEGAEIWYYSEKRWVTLRDGKVWATGK